MPAGLKSTTPRHRHTSDEQIALTPTQSARNGLALREFGNLRCGGQVCWSTLNGQAYAESTSPRPHRPRHRRRLSKFKPAGMCAARSGTLAELTRREKKEESKRDKVLGGDVSSKRGEINNKHFRRAPLLCAIGEGRKCLLLISPLLLITSPPNTLSLLLSSFFSLLSSLRCTLVRTGKKSQKKALLGDYWETIGRLSPGPLRDPSPLVGEVAQGLMGWSMQSHLLLAICSPSSLAWLQPA